MSEQTPLLLPSFSIFRSALPLGVAKNFQFSIIFALCSKKIYTFALSKKKMSTKEISNAKQLFLYL